MFDYLVGFLSSGLNNVDYISHACKMDKFFTLHVHHGEYFDENPQKYVGGEVGAVEDCDPNK